MQHFYDGQIRRYITQTIRAMSNFVVKYGDGSLHRVPVMYGDPDRQVAAIIRQNSENKINSAPRISVYVTTLALDRERLSDSSWVGKVHVKERDIQTDTFTGRETYNQAQGKNYTVERIMPTPFKLTMKCDIWCANTDQKLQILEQILVLFNPSLEIQTSDNYIDWTSLSVLNLNDIAWSSRSVPQGADTAIDVATLTLDTPIWLSPPVKVKHLGVITKIITSIHEGADTSWTNIDGLGTDLSGGTTNMGSLLTRDTVTITDYNIQVYNGQAIILGPAESTIPDERQAQFEIPVRQGIPINWQEVLDVYPGKYTAGSSRMYLTQPNGSEVVGTVAINPLNNTILTVNWDKDTLTSNTGIDSSGRIEGVDNSYGSGTNYRENSPGTVDAIIDPMTFNPKRPKKEGSDQPIAVGQRYLIIDDIGNTINTDGPDAWKSTTNVDLIAHANDIIEWTGTQWNVIFNSNQEPDTMVWQTNIYTGVQYLWNGVQWIKSFEGEYRTGEWRLEL